MNDVPDPDEISDEERTLLAELGSALGDDPLPSGIVERAEGLVAWFGVDDELVALLEEHRDELVGTRGATAAMSFVTPDRSTEVEIDVATGVGGRTIVGHQLAGEAATARLVAADGTERGAATIDELGRFEIVVDARGPHRLRLVAASGSTVTTDWFVL